MSYNPNGCGCEVCRNVNTPKCYPVPGEYGRNIGIEWAAEKFLERFDPDYHKPTSRVNSIGVRESEASWREWKTLRRQSLGWNQSDVPADHHIGGTYVRELVGDDGVAELVELSPEELSLEERVRRTPQSRPDVTGLTEQQAIWVDALFDGLTNAAACREAGINERTGQRWLAKIKIDGLRVTIADGRTKTPPPRDGWRARRSQRLSLVVPELRTNHTEGEPGLVTRRDSHQSWCPVFQGAGHHGIPEPERHLT